MSPLAGAITPQSSVIASRNSWTSDNSPSVFQFPGAAAINNTRSPTITNVNEAKHHHYTSPLNVSSYSSDKLDMTKPGTVVPLPTKQATGSSQLHEEQCSNYFSASNDTVKYSSGGVSNIAQTTSPVQTSDTIDSSLMQSLQPTVVFYQTPQVDSYPPLSVISPGKAAVQNITAQNLANTDDAVFHNLASSEKFQQNVLVEGECDVIAIQKQVTHSASGSPIAKNKTCLSPHSTGGSSAVNKSCLSSVNCPNESTKLSEIKEPLTNLNVIALPDECSTVQPVHNILPPTNLTVISQTMTTFILSWQPIYSEHQEKDAFG